MRRMVDGASWVARSIGEMIIDHSVAKGACADANAVSNDGTIAASEAGFGCCTLEAARGNALDWTSISRPSEQVRREGGAGGHPAAQSSAAQNGYRSGEAA